MSVTAYDRASEDVGNIVEFGHVNVRVPDQRLATLFYVSGLGLTRDPYLMTGVDNMWINVGVSQFHLPSGPAQVVDGVIGLILPDLEATRARLARVAGALAATAHGVVDHGDHLEVTCPWGNRFIARGAGAAPGSMRLGIAYVALNAPPGTSGRIARFYREVLRAPATAADGEARVGIGTDFVLRFIETEAAGRAWDGNHIQISLADFSGPHRWLAERGLIAEESDQHQYRFNDVVDVDTGERLVTVEHEVRSMRHPLYARRLVNRNARQSNRSYVTGHEDQPWMAPA